MLEGGLAIFLNVAAIATISFFISNLAVSVVVSRLAQRFMNIDVDSRKKILWLLALTPWIAMICVATCFVYQYYNDTVFNLNDSIAHWHHMTVFSVWSWHSVSILVATGFLIFVFVKKLYALVMHQQEIALLKALSTPLSNNVVEIPLPEAQAFTTGIFSKVCYITSGMLASTSKQEQVVIMQHEQAHADSNDPAKKWLFSFFSCFFLPSVNKRLKLHMTLAMEQAADKAVITQETPATFVASTLIKVARLNSQHKQTSVISSELSVNFGADVLEQRVFFLLGQLELKPANKLFTTALLLATVVTCILSVDVIHHLMETVFNH